ncbi:PIN domain-containing protein [Desulfobacterales bacterium HSG17]|nr:PIN domain-containing protein [Desulfobacterales bacterium HSG17]
MRFISTKDLGFTLENIWEVTKQKQDIIITAEGRPIAILTGINEDTLAEELEALKRARAMNALDMIHKDSVIKGNCNIISEDIQAEIDLVRKERSKGIKAPALAEVFELPDENDAPFLEAALAADADILITGNTRHFPEELCKGQVVMTPAEFIEKGIEK